MTSFNFTRADVLSMSVREFNRSVSWLTACRKEEKAAHEKAAKKGR